MEVKDLPTAKAKSKFKLRNADENESIEVARTKAELLRDKGEATPLGYSEVEATTGEKPQPVGLPIPPKDIALVGDLTR